MNKRSSISFFMFTLSVASIYAQWTEKDSLNLMQMLSGEKEIKLNQEVIRKIILRTPVVKDEQKLELEISAEKPELKFIEYLPAEYNVDNKNEIKQIYMTLKPYNIFTKYNEDPIYGNKKISFIPPEVIQLRNTPLTEIEKTYHTSFPGLKDASQQVPTSGVVFMISISRIIEGILELTKKTNPKKMEAWETY